METYSHMMPGVGDVAATTLEEPLADLLLPYCCQALDYPTGGLFVFAGFAGKKKSRRTDSNRLPLLITSELLLLDGSLLHST